MQGDANRKVCDRTDRLSAPSAPLRETSSADPGQPVRQGGVSVDYVSCLRVSVVKALVNHAARSVREIRKVAPRVDTISASDPLSASPNCIHPRFPVTIDGIRSLTQRRRGRSAAAGRNQCGEQRIDSSRSTGIRFLTGFFTTETRRK